MSDRRNLYLAHAALRAAAELTTPDQVEKNARLWIGRVYRAECEDSVVGPFVGPVPLVDELPIREADIRFRDVCEMEEALGALIRFRQNRKLSGPRFSRYLSILRNHHERSRSVSGGRHHRTHVQTLLALIHIMSAGGGVRIEDLNFEILKSNLEEMAIRNWERGQTRSFLLKATS